ncbi:hypothetical protein DV738_g1006, partial [Chaetothyriales sp. CBS 135597]
MSERPNISSDLLWEIVRNQNAYLVKSRAAGGVQFSRDPLNLTNQHSKKHAGFINDKAVAVLDNGKGGVVLQTKKGANSHQPASHLNTHSYGPAKTNRSTYKSIADAVGKRSYRPDLNQAAVSRASALKDAQRVKKDTPAKKPRGVKAKATSA